MMAVPDNLATLIEPVALHDFFDRYWGKERLLISRNDTGRYSHLLSTAEIDDLVRFGPWCFIVPDGVGPAESQTVVRGTPSERPIGGTRPLELHELRSFYQQGKTILLNRLQLRLPSVAALGRGLEEALQCPINVNAYLTPAGARGFSPHFDDHDVFICQLEGTKIWRFYESGRELPLKFERGALEDELTSEPTGECRLCPGDLLYLPRGVGHGAFTEDERSLHLTIGAGVVRWADVLERAVACLSRKEVALRESLPIGWVGDDETRTSMRDQFHRLLQMLADQALFDDGLRDLSLRFVDVLRELPDGSLVESSDIAGLDVETLIEKRPGNICVVTCEDDFATIYFPGGNLRGPSMIAEALEFVASVERPFRVFELPGAMSAESKKVLVRRLAKEHLLRRVGAQPRFAPENG